MCFSSETLANRRCKVSINYVNIIQGRGGKDQRVVLDRCIWPLLNVASKSAKEHSLTGWSAEYLREGSFLSFFNLYEFMLRTWETLHALENAPEVRLVLRALSLLTTYDVT